MTVAVKGCVARSGMTDRDGSVADLPPEARTWGDGGGGVGLRGGASAGSACVRDFFNAPVGITCLVHSDSLQGGMHSILPGNVHSPVRVIRLRPLRRHVQYTRGAQVDTARSAGQAAVVMRSVMDRVWKLGGTWTMLAGQRMVAGGSGEIFVDGLHYETDGRIAGGDAGGSAWTQDVPEEGRDRAADFAQGPGKGAGVACASCARRPRLGGRVFPVGVASWAARFCLSLAARGRRRTARCGTRQRNSSPEWAKPKTLGRSTSRNSQKVSSSWTSGPVTRRVSGRGCCRGTSSHSMPSSAPRGPRSTSSWSTRAMAPRGAPLPSSFYEQGPTWSLFRNITWALTALGRHRAGL